MSTDRVDAIGFGDKQENKSYNVKKMDKPDFSKMILAALGVNVPTLPENFSIGDALGRGGGDRQGAFRS